MVISSLTKAARMQIRSLPFSKTNSVYSLHVDHKKSIAPPTNDSTHTQHHNLPQLKLHCLRTGRLTSTAPEIGTEPEIGPEQVCRHCVQLDCSTILETSLCMEEVELRVKTGLKKTLHLLIARLLRDQSRQCTREGWEVTFGNCACNFRP
jgi:hypothetical protein